ncbi:DUF3566 domain-containing protein [Aeromicrobium sp. 9AM]|uniref:DUF3566 domain-containing protein n=1 Tax=Aeromicrobium sp. 9AM TaxID=2653126 RepID=UPI0012F270F5|nr:DUF3566 domain-containing protein [Aeromicrobium sp. 9AM]VXC51876.1 conserved hypothetical protein [Aeromicrobium sp. 9AM]
MTEDDKQDSTSAPGSSAGDAAPTQQIPRIPKPVTSPAKSSTGTKGAAGGPTKKAAAGKSASSGGPQTDKGRPRPAQPAKAEPEAEDKKSSEGDDTSSDSRPLTAADYARTTKPSPSTTAVIPAVKDKVGNDREQVKTKSGATLTRSPEPESTRRASLRLTHIEPWSVTRLAFAISVAMMIVAVVAVSIFWVVMEATGVWDQINGSVTSVLSDDSSSFNITDYLGFGRMVGLTLVLSAINVILTTALATIGAHLYNLAAQLLGGVDVTFAEEK